MDKIISALLSAEPSKLEVDYRSRELPRDYIEPPFALRLDGVSFGKRLSDLPGPRNWGVHRALVVAASDLGKTLGADIVYVVSDEVNMVFERLAPYRGRVLKLISVLPSLLSSRVSLSLGRPLAFDARAIRLYDEKDVARYILYRARVGLNNYAISMARAKGLLSEATPHIEYVVGALGGVDLSLGWGTLIVRGRRVDLCEFLSSRGLC